VALMNETVYRLSLTLGPVFFNWPNDRWLDFYARIADEAAVERVVLGEVVCSKREPFRSAELLATAERLQRGGKEVVYATLALPTTKREMQAISDLVESGLPVEANDIATIHLLNGKPHICGPFLNVYNEAALGMHLGLGASRVCLPPELPFDSVRRMAAMSEAVEVFAFGRPPLAISARCYHARAHGLPKDACQFVCEKDGDGLAVDTMDGVSFLAANGVQTLGHVVVALTRQVTALRDAGVASLRLSPQACDMVKVAEVFRALADGTMAPPEAEAALGALDLPGPLSDGYLRGLPGARLLDEVE
jgi:O2-independent ubiquinone biosynthesis protein UbiV